MRILLLLLLPFNVFANDWSTADTWRESGWQIINFIDYRQTSDISGAYYEQNPVLGRYPSQGKIDKYFAISAITHYGISRLLPFNYRSSWQWLTIGISGAVVYHNYRIGIKINL